MLYLDTSVLGGYFDAEFQADTRAPWRLREMGRFRFFTSPVVLGEISRAPARVRALLESDFAKEDMIDFNDEMEALAAAYLAQRIVPPDCVGDAEHVAVCVVARLDYLVSWNFKHLANVRRETGFNAVNVLQGYPPVRIVAPTFLIHGDEEKNLWRGARGPSLASNGGQASGGDDPDRVPGVSAEVDRRVSGREAETVRPCS